MTFLALPKGHMGNQAGTPTALRMARDPEPSIILELFEFGLLVSGSKCTSLPFLTSFSHVKYICGEALFSLRDLLKIKIN